MVERRTSQRGKTYKVARIAFGGNRAVIGCLVRDLSETGACLNWVRTVCQFTQTECPHGAHPMTGPDFSRGENTALTARRRHHACVSAYNHRICRSNERPHPAHRDRRKRHIQHTARVRVSQLGGRPRMKSGDGPAIPDLLG